MSRSEVSDAPAGKLCSHSRKRASSLPNLHMLMMHVNIKSQMHSRGRHGLLFSYKLNGTPWLKRDDLSTWLRSWSVEALKISDTCTAPIRPLAGGSVRLKLQLPCNSSLLRQGFLHFSAPLAKYPSPRNILDLPHHHHGQMLRLASADFATIWNSALRDA